MGAPHIFTFGDGCYCRANAIGSGRIVVGGGVAVTGKLPLDSAADHTLMQSIKPKQNVMNQGGFVF